MDEVFDELHHLIKKGDLIAFRAEIEKGIDPNLSNKLGWTLLMMTALHGRSDMASLLLLSGADSRKMNKFGNTAASLAKNKGYLKLAEMLSGAI